MIDTAPLYNSRIIKIFLEYLEKYYPDLDMNSILQYANMTKYNVGDPGHWFSQYQVDRFYEIVTRMTGNPNTAKEAGRYLTSSKDLGPVKQYMLGFINPMSLYMLMEKLYTTLSRGAVVSTKKLSANSVEIISMPRQGVDEKPYQCDNRLGGFESLAKLFTNNLAKIEHPECFHKGYDRCRYVVSWEKTSSLIWRRIRNYFLIFNLVVPIALFFFLPFLTWALISLLFIALTLALSSYAEYVKSKELTKTIENQGDAAEKLLDEINIRHENAMLVQEIGQATSAILDENELIQTVMRVIRRRLDFDRGLIMLSNREKTRLNYSDSFGYTRDQEELLNQTAFHLDKPESRGVFVVSYKLQKPFLINDMSEIANNLSKRSLELAKKMGVQSLICVPIVYEKESLGILAVDNIESKRPLTQSDMS
ncbi:MAG: GAF domain-containing protein, partial [Deltaproteobacteria bacterium]|nr:GAF domain-containing protein [Deltaproteobacteria bacterium]